MILKSDITTTKSEIYCWSFDTSALTLSHIKGFRSHPHPAFGFNELDLPCPICLVGLNRKEASWGKSACNFEIYLFFLEHNILSLTNLKWDSIMCSPQEEIRHLLRFLTSVGTMLKDYCNFENCHDFLLQIKRLCVSPLLLLLFQVHQMTAESVPTVLQRGRRFWKWHPGTMKLQSSEPTSKEIITYNFPL